MRWFEDIELPDPERYAAVTIKHVGSNETSLMRYTVCASIASISTVYKKIVSTMNYNDADDAAVFIRRRLRTTRRLLGHER